MSGPRALVLMYHQIEPDIAPSGWLPNNLADPRYGLGQSRFREQMALLKEGTLPVMGIDEFLSVPESGGNKHPLSIIVTFDDGYASDWERAAPVLDEYGIPATFFLSTGHLGNPGMLSPRQARELASCSLFSLGSHGVTHRFLSHLSSDECSAEVRESLESLSAFAGDKNYSFSAPGGRTNVRVQELVRKAGYKALLTSSPGIFQKGNNRFAIPRLPVMKGWSIDEFRKLLDPASLPFFVNRCIRSLKAVVQSGLELPRTVSLQSVFGRKRS